MSDSLKLLMNNMVDRLGDVLPDEELSHIPEERYWHMISLYIQIDPVLAQLYKQYCEAKGRLGDILSGEDANGPMAEIAWDMHDSLRSAIDTRLIELENSPKIRETLEKMETVETNRLKAETEEKRAKKEASSLNSVVNFLIWTNLVFKDMALRADLTRDFAQAS